MAENGELGRAESAKLPRAERVCARCDHSRRLAMEIRCHFNPPSPCMIGMQPPTLQGQLPRPIIIGVVPSTWAGNTCGSWAEMQPDHPDFEVGGEELVLEEIPAPTHDVSRETQ